MTIAIAKDEAFNFTYRANIDMLAGMGEVVYFSPMRDAALPECDILYLPGGYPELFAEAISANASMRESIRRYAEQGGRVYAECGGFMYLTESIEHDGVIYPMCGVLPMKATMCGARLHLGYRSMLWKGRTMRGHEFHYSSVDDNDLPDGIHVMRLQQSAKGQQVDTPIYRYKNVIAGYTHWYWAEEGFPFFELGDRGL